MVVKPRWHYISHCTEGHAYCHPWLQAFTTTKGHDSILINKRERRVKEGSIPLIQAVALEHRLLMLSHTGVAPGSRSLSMVTVELSV